MICSALFLSNSSHHPRQWQTRREAGTQSYGLLTARGGADKAARLPKGWTGPRTYAWPPGHRKVARLFLRAELRKSRQLFLGLIRWIMDGQPDGEPIRVGPFDAVAQVGRQP